MLQGFLDWFRMWFVGSATSDTAEPPKEPIEPVIVDRVGEPIRDTTWQPIAALNDWEREAKALRAAYGVCVMERDEAQGKRVPNLEALAYGLLQALGMESTSALHRELDSLLRKRRVSGS